MAEHGSTECHRIPFKACPGYLIQHKQLSIRLNVDWTTNGGDDPNLIIEITDTDPLTLPFPQNQSSSSSSIFFNSVHRHQHPLQQDSGGSTIREENYFYHHQQQLPARNDHKVINAAVKHTPVNQNDVSTTSTRLTSQNEDIEKIANDLKSQIPTFYQRTPAPNSRPPFSPHRMQPSVFGIDDIYSTMPMPVISPSAPIESMTSMTACMTDCSSNPSWNYPPSRRIICRCTLAPNKHSLDCPVTSLNTPNSIVPSASLHRSSNDQIIAFPFQTYSHAVSLRSSEIEPTITTMFTPAPNLNPMQTSDLTTIRSQPSSIIHYTPSKLAIRTPVLDVNRSLHQSSIDFQSMMPDANLFDYQMNLEGPTTMIQQPTTKSSRQRQPKKRSVPRKNSKRVDLSPLGILNDRGQMGQHTVVIDSGTFLLSPEFPSSPHPPSTPSRTGREIKLVHDNNMIASGLSTDSVLRSPVNDTKQNSTQQQQSPQNVGLIRSPVKLDILVSQTANSSEGIPAIVDQTIIEVAQGEGEVSLIDTSTSFSSQFQPYQMKHPSIDQQAWRQDLFVGNKAFQPILYHRPRSTANDLNMSASAHRVFQSATEDQDMTNTSFSQSKTTKKVKPIKPKSTTNPPKRACKTSTNTQQSTAIVSPCFSDITQTATTTLTSPSNCDIARPVATLLTSPVATTPSSHSDTVRTVTEVRTSSVTPMLRSGNQLVAWFGPPGSLEKSLGCEMTSPPSKPVVDLPVESINIDSMSDTFTMSDSHDSARSDYFEHDEDEQFIDSYTHGSLQMDDDDDVDDLSLQNDKPLIPLTLSPLPPAPLPSVPMSTLFTSQVLTPASTEKPSSASTASTTNCNDLDEFLDPPYCTSSSTWEDNQLISSVLTPLDFSNNFLSYQVHEQQQQHYSPPQTYLDGSPQPQISASNIDEINPRIFYQMNDKNEVPSLSTPKAKQKPPKKRNHQSNAVKTSPTKISKRPNRSNLTPKIACTRCGVTGLIDITHHEFPEQKGLVFECTSCGNNSIRSNVCADERRRRLLKVATDHLSTIVCQFCHKTYHSHGDYLNHLKDDHRSNKP